MTTCQQKIIDHCKCGNENILFFCLLFKEYLSKCPPCCSYFIKGPSHSMRQLYQSKLEMECPYFHLLAKNLQISDFFQFFVCEVTGKPPDCDQCPLEG